MKDLKEIFTNKIQYKTGKKVYIQALNDRLNCIVKGKNKSKLVLFIYNDSEEKVWKINDDIIKYNSNNEILTYDFICVFVCEGSMYEEYHMIEFRELLEVLNVSFEEFKENKDYMFEDNNDKYRDVWEIFKKLDI